MQPIPNAQIPSKIKLPPNTYVLHAENNYDRDCQIMFICPCRRVGSKSVRMFQLRAVCDECVLNAKHNRHPKAGVSKFDLCVCVR